MEEKKFIKISLTQAIIIIVAILAIIFGIIFFIYNRVVAPSSNITSITSSTSRTTTYSDTGKTIPTNSNAKYNVLSSSCDGSDNLENLFVTSNEELKTYLLKCFKNSSYESKYSNRRTQNTNQTSSLNKIMVNGQPVLTYFDDNFFEKNNLAIQMYDASYSHHHYSIISVTKENSTATVNIKDNSYTYGGAFGPTTNINFIVLDKSINKVNYDIYRTTIDNSHSTDYRMFFISGTLIAIAIIAIVSMLVIKHNKKVENKTEVKSEKGRENKTETEPKSKTKQSSNKIIFGIVIGILVLIGIFFAIVSFESLMSPNTASYKPIIYLYPEKDEEVSVKLLNDDMITVSYPKYNTSWNVLAKKDGTLTDLSTNKNLYSLYYECENKVNFKIKNDGFMVKGSDVATFLEEKLAILGLTERESEEFIIYWLPKLEANKYNYIRFATSDEMNTNMPLEINPNPDTLIRVLMTFKGLDNPIEVQEQKLITPERNGFVAVEWGGTEIY